MRFRLFLALLLLAATPALLLACGEEAEVDVDENPADIANPDLLGHWIVVEQNDETPTEEVRYFFSPQGELARTSPGDSVATQAQYSFVTENQLSITDITGTQLYNYEITAAGEMTMTEPVEDGNSFQLRRIAELELENVPPPASTDIPEDSIPVDGGDEDASIE